MRSSVFILAVTFFLFNALQSSAQFTPVPVTGFNHDAIAEGAPNSLATTTLEVDGASSNKVMYSNAFRTFAGIAGGGLPDNGTIVNGGDTYQLAPFTGNNALYVKRNEAFNLSIATPASFARIRILGFTTEGASSLNISLSFTDGTTTPYLTNYSLSDWFNGTTNLVLQGFGRCDRSAGPAYNADAFPTNPRMYYMEVILTCADLQKQLQSVNFSNVSTFPNNAPFPNAVLLAVSGLAYSQTVTPTITPSDCAGPNGSIALNVTGSSSPYTYSWNTTPAQTSSTATGLAPGNYSCTITDANGCTSPYNGVVPLTNNASIVALGPPMAICSGNPAVLTANVLIGNLANFSWQPGNLTGQTVTVSPATTTTYTVTGTNALGCTASSQVAVAVNPLPALPAVTVTPVCSGATATLQIQSPQAGYTYNWYDAATAGTLLSTGTSFTTPVLTANTTYHVEAINTTGCFSMGRTAVTVVVNSLPAAPAASNISICPNTNGILSVLNPQAGFTYNWYDAANGGTLLATGVSYTTTAIATNSVYYVSTVSSSGCTSNTRTAVAITLLQPVAQPVVTVANVSFTAVTFSWTAVPGAVGYEVTTNGGASFQTPSSGATGTTHTINGLNGNQTIIIQVRALGPQVCENSILSAPVPATTLSSKEIFVPNVFTPNGDGRNDVLLVYGNYIASIQLRIFNQWGQLIFSSDNISTGWNGMYKGQQQPVGVYAYTLKAVRQDGTIVTKKGSINLIR